MGRVCKWCGVDISHRKKSAIFCGDKCREVDRTARRYPNRGKRHCRYCEREFMQPQKGSPKLYCGPACKEAVRSTSQPRTAWRNSPKGREIVRAAKQKYNKSEHGILKNRELQKLRTEDGRQKEARIRYRATEKGMDAGREYYNSRAAAASSLSIAHTISQIKAGDLTNGDN